MAWLVRQIPDLNKRHLVSISADKRADESLVGCEVGGRRVKRGGSLRRADPCWRAVEDGDRADTAAIERIDNGVIAFPGIFPGRRLDLGPGKALPDVADAV